MNILTINLALSTFVFWVVAKLYLLTKLQDYEARTILLPILLLHSLRHLGLMFLASGATYPGIPPQFTHPAAYGDLMTAVLALIAIPAVATRARSAKFLVWLFNLVGSLDRRHRKFAPSCPLMTRSGHRGMSQMGHFRTNAFVNYHVTARHA
jgi:hypothetical protein